MKATPRFLPGLTGGPHRKGPQFQGGQVIGPRAGQAARGHHNSLTGTVMASDWPQVS